MQSMDLGPVIVAIAVGVPAAAMWAVALVDLARRADWEFPGWQPGSNDRMVWVLVVLLFNAIGALAYYYKVMKPFPRQRR